MDLQNEGQEEVKVAFLGPSASFGHQAASESFSSYSSTSLQPLPTFGAILSAIQNSSGKSGSLNDTSTSFDFALLPVENSTNGGVVPVLDLLTKCDSNSAIRPALYPDIEVVGEHYLQVHHCLFVHPSVEVPLPVQGNKTTSIDHDLKQATTITTTTQNTTPLYQKYNIDTLYTHPQVWGQCAKFLLYHFPEAHVERRNMSSTSAAAVYVARNTPTMSSTAAAALPPTGSSTERQKTPDEDPCPTPRASETGAIAAISSALAGVENNLASLANNIEDEPGKNKTRFFIIRNKRRPLLQSSILQRLPWLYPATSASPNNHLSESSPSSLTSNEPIFYKTLITFTIPHSTPGSLALALAVFQKYNFNLTAITTRPSGETPWHYVFFTECEGQQPYQSREDHGRDVDLLFEELTRFTERGKILGTWVNRLR